MPLSLAAALPALGSREFPQKQTQNLQLQQRLKQQDCVWFSTDAAVQRHLHCSGQGEFCGDNGASWGVKTVGCVGTNLAELQQRF